MIKGVSVKGLTIGQLQVVAFPCGKSQRSQVLRHLRCSQKEAGICRVREQSMQLSLQRHDNGIGSATTCLRTGRVLVYFVSEALEGRSHT